MLGITDYGTFVITIIVFLAIPGPGNLALVTSTSKGGIRWRTGRHPRGDSGRPSTECGPQ